MGFKVVCISSPYPDEVKVGRMYGTVDSWQGQYELIDGVLLGISVDKECFLRLPEEPKTCAEMTMEEYLAMVCLRGNSPSLVSACSDGEWYEVIDKHMTSKSNASILYKLTDNKTPKQVEIERIEGEMRKLADSLNKLKGV